MYLEKIILGISLKNIINAAAYFLLSTVITGWFIEKGNVLYDNTNMMLFSGSIAGAKWGIQIIAAYIFLEDKKGEFIEQIGFTCFVGSCLLLPYCLLPFLQNFEYGFVLSLVLSVVTMIFLYYQSVKKMDVSVKWFWAWIGCLIVAVSLQVFVIFKLF